MGDTGVEHVDVLIVGAGISGVGGAYHLTHQCPDKRFVVWESQESFGGTWRTHTYPGIRSDSDLYTFGYRFKPWTGAPIATADKILTYMGEVIEENGLDAHIRYHHQITDAVWDSDEACWTVTATVTGGAAAEAAVEGEAGAAVDESAGAASTRTATIRADFLWMCQGYYRHSEGYTPEWPGMADFAGPIVHPQRWPDDLDHADKKVVVIGSGATAATLIPAMAPDVEHITMLQRSPTYFATGRNANELADTLRELEIDETWIHEIVRRKVLFDGAMITRMSREEPEAVKTQLADGIREIMGEDYALDPHFTPTYRPWRQRIAFVPDGDLFHAIKSGKASVVTDEIEQFEAGGIRLKSGDLLDADIIITATGFNLNVLGDIAFTIDGEPMNFADTITWRGTMFTGVPNLAWVFGYFRASWTLRADLIADLVCRLLQHMDERGAKVVTPTLRPDDEGMPLLPWVDPEDFNPGYINRGVHLLPKQGDRQPWKHTQDYWTDKDEMPSVPFDDNSLVFD